MLIFLKIRQKIRRFLIKTSLHKTKTRITGKKPAKNWWKKGKKTAKLFTKQNEDVLFRNNCHIFGPFLAHFQAAKIFFQKSGYVTRNVTLVSTHITIFKKSNDGFPRKCLGRWTDGRTDGQDWFYRTLQPSAGVQKEFFCIYVLNKTSAYYLLFSALCFMHIIYLNSKNQEIWQLIAKNALWT